MRKLQVKDVLTRIYEVNEEELNIELFYIMTSLPFFDELCKNASSGSTNRQYLDEKKFLNQEITLPPIDEQNSFIEHFKKLQEKHSQTLEELQTQSELISKLRSSILSDAVSGKLVPEDTHDESAEVLLEKIKAEKEKLTKAGKIKKQKPLPPISEDEIPYELPDGWVFTKIGEISNYGTLEKKKPTQIQNGDWILELEDIDKETSNINKKLYYPKRIVKSEKNIFYTNYILYSKLRPYLNKVVVAEDNGVCTSEIIPFHSFGYINPFFLQLILKSKEFVNYANNSTHGMNLPRVSTEIVRNYIFGLPPLKEQKRIVEKVEKLMATCDALELEVQNSKIETEKLMQSVLKEAFADSETSKSEKKEPKASKAFQRSVLAAYIVDNSLEDRYFGHAKLQKMLFMCEAVNNLDFDSNYKRHAMGPYDPKLIRSVDSQLKRNKWFECKKMDGDKGRYIYTPLEKQDEYKKYLDRYFKLENIEKMFSLMKPMTTLQAEIVATLYSVYKDLKSTQKNISSQMLIDEARNNWHDRKKTIEVEKWERAIDWMREKQLIS